MNEAETPNPYQSPGSETPTAAPAGAIIAAGELTTGDLIQVYRAAGYRNWRWLPVYLVLAGSVFGVFLLKGELTALTTRNLAVFLGLPLLLAVIAQATQYYWGAHWRSARGLLEKGPLPMRFTLEEEGLRYEVNQTDNLFPWDRFTRLHAGRELLVLYLNREDWLALPARFFASRDAFLAAAELSSRKLRQNSSPTPELAASDAATRKGPAGVVIAVGRLTEQEFLATKRSAIRKKVLEITLVVAAICCIPIGVVVFNTSDMESRAVAGLVVLMVLGLIPFLWWTLRNGFRQQYRTSRHASPPRWVITAEGISLSPNDDAENLNWNAFDEITLADDSLTFRRRKKEPLLLPRRFCISDAEWRQVLEWAQLAPKK
ncbi:YcxB family protein [Blastopirellula marina]|uniref:YcxB-like protein domain-containing protein n=1 Tax=Blastopirellula marina TaxID=124 RepID=A0A2S8FTR1_9BACT|nr:YcxB family protein [Blastopirellula marina]PQO35578.1 hypothetical protein C5Y98_13105 [Blastopirellula marina]PTL44217.1 hypothetical protein C5Y97_13115 [Blastopirellula marina]